MNLKIALFNESFPPFIDGVSNTVVNYAEVIHSKLGEAFVVTPRLKGVFDDYPYKVIRYHSIPTGKKVQYPAGNPLSLPAIRAIKRENPDIIHVHSPFSSSVLARVCSTYCDCPVVLTYHTKFEQDIACKLSTRPMQKVALDFILQNVKSADEVWAVTEGCGDSLKSIGYNGKYRVMENGTDFPKGYVSQMQVEKINQEYNLDSKEPLLLFVGRMMWYKNIRIILDALQKSHLSGRKFKMIFVGDGLDIDEIRAYAKRLGMNSYVIFAGAVRDREKLRAFYTRANLFMFPSTYDTSGLVVKEAAACDTPSILVRNSCAAEGIVDGFSGFLCEENAFSCSVAVNDALDNPAKLTAIGKNAGRYVYLSWEDSIRKAYARYEEIYKIWHSIPQMNRRRVYRKLNK